LTAYRVQFINGQFQSCGVQFYYLPVFVLVDPIAAAAPLSSIIFPFVKGDVVTDSLRNLLIIAGWSFTLRKG
jgi:hypothetical protein